MKYSLLAALLLSLSAQAGLLTEELHVGVIDRHLSYETKGISQYLAKLCKLNNDGPNCILRGLSLKQNMDADGETKSLWDPSLDEGGTLVDSQALVLSAARQITLTEANTTQEGSVQVLGKKIYAGDYVRVTHDDVIVTEGINGYIPNVVAIDVVHPNPRIQCISPVQSDGKIMTLDMGSGFMTGKNGPNFYLRADNCKLDEEGYCLDTFATGNIRPDQFAKEGALSASTSSESFGIDRNFFRKQLIAINGEEAYWKFAKFNHTDDFKLTISSMQTLNQLPVTSKRISARNAKALVKSGIAPVNAKLTWTNTIAGSTLKPASGSIDLSCSRWE